MDRYTARINFKGTTQRERNVNRLKDDILKNLHENPSYKSVLLNGSETSVSITDGTKPYYKEFQSLPGQKIVAGDYIEWSNYTWLVYTADCDDEIYIDGELRQCQYKIYWQDSYSNILSRYAWIQNASAYNNGEQGNSTLTLQSNQFMVYIPYDKDTEMLDNGTRIHISKSNRNCRPYKLTRPDDITYKYGEKGVLNIIFTQCQYNQETDKLITLEDNSQVWICDYHSPTDSPAPPIPNETTDLSVSISGGTTLRCGRVKSWTVKFTNKDGSEVTDYDFKWNVVSDFDVVQTVNGQKIQLKINDEQMIDCSFLLQVTDINDAVIKEIEITVIEGL